MGNKDKEQEMFLHGLSNEAEEFIAENYPALDDDAMKRIMLRCGLDDLNETEISVTTNEKKENIDDTVEGTEIYNRPVWYKFAGIAAAFVLAAVGIGGAALLGRNGKPLMDPSGKVAFSGGTKPDGAVISAETQVEEATEAVTTAQPVVTVQPVATESTSTTSTTSSTTISTTTTVTSTDSENTEPAPTEAATESVTTTAVAEEVISIDDVHVPSGYWMSESNGRKYYWNFHADGSGGMFIDSESGIGNGFSIEVRDGGLMFHFVSVYDESPASISWQDNGDFIITWGETGPAEHFTPDPDAHINDF